MRRGSRVLIAAVLGLGLALAPPAAGRRSAAAVLVPRTTGAALARARVLRVRVRAAHAGRVRVLGFVRDAAGTAISITRGRTVRVRAGRSRRVALRLTSAGRRALAGCDLRGLEVRVLTAPGGRGRPRLLRRGRRGLLRARGCRVPRPVPFAATDEGRCDPIDAAVCLQPFPDDYFTVPDASTVTGRRVDLQRASMPQNNGGVAIDPSDIDRNDGFSPGAPIVTRVPGLDTPAAFARSGAVPQTDLARTYDARQPVVVLDARTLQRQLIWTEIDANPTSAANVNLIIHPAANLQEGHRYIVALRDLRDGAGRPLAPSEAFRLYRDRVISTDPGLEARRAHFENLFANLAEAGVDRDSLYRAWDFTVASERSLSERQLAIRNDAFARLGDTNLGDLTVQGSAPPFAIDRVTDRPDADGLVGRRVEGHLTAPCYLNLPGCPTGARFTYPPGSTQGPPSFDRSNTTTVNFTCNIPAAALAGQPARPALYGHGLFGSRGEVNQDQLRRFTAEHDMLFCATDWVGMACSDTPGGVGDLGGIVTAALAGELPRTPNCDIPTAFAAEADLSRFPELVDRVDQSFVNFMLLGRLMIHPQGLGAVPAFQDGAGHSVIDGRRLFYDGNSQGGIFGGSLVALEPDLNRGALGVTGEDYAVLLQRSSDFGTGQPPSASDPIPQYAYPLYTAYPDQLQRPLLLSLMQQMWDHSDPDGLAAHMTTDPLPDTPAHHVLMQIGLGDHQVANVQALAEARTVGARVRLPWADPGRVRERDPTYGLSPITSYPYDGSALETWDVGPLRSAPCAPGETTCGTPPAPDANVPPSAGEDPHEAPRNQAAARQQKSDFFQIGGSVTDVCGARPCYAGSWHGP